jgi:hypothetical protein
MTLSPTIAFRHGYTAGSKQSLSTISVVCKPGRVPWWLGTCHSWRQPLSIRAAMVTRLGSADADSQVKARVEGLKRSPVRDARPRG